MSNLREIKQRMQSDPRLPPTPGQVEWLIAQIENLRSLLREVEWIKTGYYPDFCPICKVSGEHRENCRLDVALRGDK